MQQVYQIQETFAFIVFAALALLLVTHLICQRWFARFPVSGLSGGVIMALALYVAECLPYYQPPEFLLKLSMIEVFVIWVYGSFSLLHDFFLKESESRQVDRSGLAAWIAATALVAIMISKVSPLLHGAILLLVFFASILWLKYAAMVLRALVVYARRKFQEYVNAALLLGSAATVCVSWMFFVLFQDKMSIYFYQTLIVLACLIYSVVTMMLMALYLRGKMQRLLAGWSSENALVFGVAAAIGAVSIVTSTTADWLVDVLWFWSAVWCLIITILDLGHVGIQIAVRGLRKNIAYDVRHWLKIFSYCMFYIFTRDYYSEHYSDNVFVVAIAEHGLSFVNVLFLLQIMFVLLATWVTRYDRPSSIE